MPVETADRLAEELRAESARVRADVDSFFSELLAPTSDSRGRLYDAMRHAAIGGGKRLRPLLTVASSRLFAIDPSRALRAGCAIEAIHVYSLIHDDLPCMDDADLRRGKPAAHKAFGEAEAVLAGDPAAGWRGATDLPGISGTRTWACHEAMENGCGDDGEVHLCP